MVPLRADRTGGVRREDTMARARYDFSGEVALITGGAGDIGLAAARRLGGAGARIALLDLDASALESAKRSLAEAGVEAYLRACDVTQETAVIEAVEAVSRELGPVSLLFNNAGYQGDFAPTHEYSTEDFGRVLQVNVQGVFQVLKAVARQMIANGSGGAIVNTASHAGVKGPPNMVAYGASKFAVIGLTQSASKDLAPYKVRVNAISPALIGPGRLWTRQCELQAATNTQYFPADSVQVQEQMIGSVPLRRLGALEEVADSVAFLLSGESSYLTGFNLEITGGL